MGSIAITVHEKNIGCDIIRTWGRSAHATSVLCLLLATRTPCNFETLKNFKKRSRSASSRRPRSASSSGSSVPDEVPGFRRSGPRPPTRSDPDQTKF